MKALVRRRLLLLVPALLLASLVWAATADAYIYWAGGQRIARADNDGTGVEYEFLKVPGQFTCGVAVDSSHIYWGDVTGHIGRANLDGTGFEPEFIKVPGVDACGVAVTPTYIYWSDQNGKVGRASLNGTDVDTEWAAATDACGIATLGNSVYVDKQQGASYELLEMDGTQSKGTVSHALPVENGRCGVAVDDSHVYWSHTAPSPGNELLVGRAEVGGFLHPEPTFVSPHSESTTPITSVSVHGDWAYYSAYNGPIGRYRVDGTIPPEPSFLSSGAVSSNEIVGIAVDDLPLPVTPTGPTGPGGGTGGAPAGSGSSAGGGTTPLPAFPPAALKPKPKPLVCRKGTHRKVVKGKARCVKVAKHKHGHHHKH